MFRSEHASLSPDTLLLPMPSVNRQKWNISQNFGHLGTDGVTIQGIGGALECQARGKFMCIKGFRPCQPIHSDSRGSNPDFWTGRWVQVFVTNGVAEGLYELTRGGANRDQIDCGLPNGDCRS